MFYEKYTLICNICAILCVFFYILTPNKGMKVSISEVSAKEAQTATGSTATGVSLWLSDEWKKDKPKEILGNGWDRLCDMNCKIETLTKIGIRDEIAESLVTNCKALTDNPRKCIIIGASIVKNESGWWYKCKRQNPYNCFGLYVKEDYKSYNDWVIHWIGKWNKYWHKAKDMNHFYSPAWKLPPTRFCTSEDSTGSSVGCPAGLKNSSIIFNKLNKIF